MDFGKSFVYMFQDPSWFRKLLIGTLLVLAAILFSWLLVGLIPLLIVLGWAQVTLRNVLDGQEHPMPEWEDWGDFIVRGLKLGVAMLIWLLPIFILILPMILGSALLGNQSNSSAAGGVLIACASCLMLLWGIFVALISPSIYIRLAATGRLRSAFEASRLWRITREHLGPVIISLLLIAVAGFIGSIVGSLGIVLCLIGALITGPLAMLWQYLVTAHLFGQIGGLDRAARSDDLALLEPLPAPIEVAPFPAPVEPPAPEIGPTAPEAPAPDAPTGQQ